MSDETKLTDRYAVVTDGGGRYLREGDPAYGTASIKLPRTLADVAALGRALVAFADGKADQPAVMTVGAGIPPHREWSSMVEVLGLNSATNYWSFATPEERLAGRCPAVSDAWDDRASRAIPASHDAPGGGGERRPSKSWREVNGPDHMLLDAPGVPPMRVYKRASDLAWRWYPSGDPWDGKAAESKESAMLAAEDAARALLVAALAVLDGAP